MTAAKALEPSSPGPAGGPGSIRAPIPAPTGNRAPIPAPTDNRALARALATTAGSRTLGFATAAAARTLARCPGCGGKCGGTCGHGRSGPDEELLASGQRALRRAVLARRQAVSPRS